MGKHKLERFAEIGTFKNVMQFDVSSKSEFNMKGRWAADYFSNNRPIVLELACGKGEYAVGLAQLDSSKNFIGIDMKGNRIWRGAKTAIEKNLTQVAFIRTYIDWLNEFFEEGEVDEIWITFSDPFLSSTKIHKRLTSPRFLNLYQKVLKKGGIINLKTDDETLYQYTLDVINGIEVLDKYPCNVTPFKILENRNNIYADGIENNAALNIKTHYENTHLQKGLTIKYIKIQYN
jgi:tRNA (guanine-N7-)-methyltransferase